MWDELLKACIGDLGYAVDVSTLSEKGKTGACPELANLEKEEEHCFKRWTDKSALNNALIKPLTGGGKLCKRGLYETKTEKTIHATFIVELNKEVPLSGEVGIAEISRFIEIVFSSRFTLNPEEVNEEEHIYPANPDYIQQPFIQKHKFAMMQLLINYHKKYAENGYLKGLKIPEKVRRDTQNYLKKSSDIIRWLEGKIDETNEKKDNRKTTRHI